MPNFSSTAPPEATRPGFRLVRTPASKGLLAIVTSDDLIGCPTHFYRNRTIPCEAPNCEPCSKGFTWRWHGYLTCVNQMNHDHVLFEMTAQASDAFREYRKVHGTLRGCLFKAQRVGSKHNGRVTIAAKPADLAGVTLPAAPNIPVMLCHIWSVPLPSVETAGLSRGHPRLNVLPVGDNGDEAR